MQPFFILSLPRSRTAWLATVLTQGPVFCQHEASLGCRSTTDLKAKLEALARSTGCKYVGAVDGVLALLHGRLDALWPKAPMVSILRPVPQVMKSMPAAAGVTSRDIMDKLTAKIDLIAQQRPVLKVPYHDLNTYEGCNRILKHVAPDAPALNLQRWEMLNDFNIQLVLERAVARKAQHQDAMTTLLSGEADALPQAPRKRRKP